LQDGCGDHEDDQKNEDDVDERHHVDVGERCLSGLTQLRHSRSLKGCHEGYGYQISATRDQEAKWEKRNAKNENRKAKREAKRGDCAAIPPLRNGKRHRCSGRDDRIKKGRTRHNAARKKRSGRSGRDDSCWGE
jgi:hypothetical protein